MAPGCPLLVEISTALDISVAMPGQVAAANFAAWAVSVVISGPSSDSFGRRPSGTIGIVPTLHRRIGLVVRVSLPMLLATRVVSGLSGGMIPPNSMAVVADIVPPHRRADTVGRLMAFNTMASVIGILFLALLAEFGGWRLPFLVLGIVMALFLLLN